MSGRKLLKIAIVACMRKLLTTLKVRWFKTQTFDLTLHEA